MQRFVFCFQKSSIKNRCFTLADINLLKIILCSGLYPHVALADENNSGRSAAEQAFHTKVRIHQGQTEYLVLVCFLLVQVQLKASHI